MDWAVQQTSSNHSATNTDDKRGFRQQSQVYACLTLAGLVAVLLSSSPAPQMVHWHSSMIGSTSQAIYSARHAIRLGPMPKASVGLHGHHLHSQLTSRVNLPRSSHVNVAIKEAKTPPHLFLLGLAALFGGLAAAWYSSLRPGGRWNEGSEWRIATTIVEKDVWSQFAEAACGEWEGFLVECTPQGALKELPDHVVPAANKEWGVALYDWQLQTCVSTQGSDLQFVQRRFYPTQGCEVDATTVHDKKNFTLSRNNPGLHFASDGSYSLGPDTWPRDCTEPYSLEFCLVDSEKRQRVRVTLQMAALAVQGASVVMEWWEGAFNADGSLPTSCGGLHPMLSSITSGSETETSSAVKLPGGISYIASSTSDGSLSVSVHWTSAGHTFASQRSWQ